MLLCFLCAKFTQYYNIIHVLCPFPYIIYFAPAMSLFHGDSGTTPYSIHHQNSPTTSIHHGNFLVKQFEEPQPQVRAMTSILFHKQHILAAVIIVFSRILFHISFNWNAKNDVVFDDRILIWQYCTHSLVMMQWRGWRTRVFWHSTQYAKHNVTRTRNFKSFQVLFCILHVVCQIPTPPIS